MQKVLIITYYWPPGSGAGVQRWLKFSKYLPSFGWEPVILTVDPRYATYPVTDRSLEKDVADDIAVYRTKVTDYFRFYRKDKSKVPSAGFATSEDSGLLSKILRFIRGNFFIPDPRRGWNKYAYRKACQILKKGEIKHVITTSPPHSTQLIGMKLKRKFSGIKWIADLRDPWTDIYYYSLFYHTPLAKAIDRQLEIKVLKESDRIITVGKSLADHFILREQSVRKKMTVITNGFDEDDFTGISPENPDVLTITYTGTLSDSYPLEGFINAVESYVKKNRAIRLRFVGLVSNNQKYVINSRFGQDTVKFIPHVDHIAALRFMHETTLLLLIIPDHPSGKCILTGKLFEYIACRKPILCLGPVDGDAAEIIADSSSGKSMDPSDSASILNFLENIRADHILEPSDITSYSRKNLTELLSRILTS